MAILVTGGAGFIGSHTCVVLQEAGYEIVVVDNFSNSKPEALRRVKTISGKDFPFYVSVSDLTTSVPSGEARRIYVGPAVSGQTVIGNLHYYFG